MVFQEQEMSSDPVRRCLHRQERGKGSLRKTTGKTEEDKQNFGRKTLNLVPPTGGL